MFTKRDKIKELIKFFAPNPKMQVSIAKNPSFAPVGVSYVMSYKYVLDDTIITYNKWYVESYDMAHQMNLPGCEKHNKLVQGSGVIASSRRLGSMTFYGASAQEIINDLESPRDIESYIHHNELVKVR